MNDNIVTITSKEGVIRYTGPIMAGSKRKFTLMQEDYVLLKFSLDEPLILVPGDRMADVRFGQFELCREYQPVYNKSTGGYDYEVRMDAHYWKWKNKIFKYTPEKGGQEASWNLTAPLDVQLGVFVKNLEALGYGAFSFDIDNTVENKAVLMSYDNTNLLDALFSMASKDKWNCDCWVFGNTIHFGRCESGIEVELKQDVNADIERVESKGAFATRIYAFGGTNNIPSNYRQSQGNVTLNGIVQKRLMLPEGTPYIDAYRYRGNEKVYIGEPDYDYCDVMPNEEAIESVVIFDSIYPKKIGLMSDVAAKEYIDNVENNDGTVTQQKRLVYRYRDSSITFSESYIIPGQELKIYMQSGKLNGMVFSVKFNPDNEPEKLKDGKWNPAAQLWEIVANETYGRSLPDDVLFPANNDKFVLTGFDIKMISETVIPETEKELKREAEKCAARKTMDDSTFTVTLFPSWVIADEANRTFGVGQRVKLVAPELFRNGRSSRVIGYELPLDIPYDHPVYTIGESAAYSRIGELQEKLESLTFKGQTYEGEKGGSVYIIRSNDQTIPTDSNVFSALRSLISFLRKDQPDQTAFLLKMLAGAEFGNYVQRRTGANIDKDGNSELEKAEIRDRVVSTDFNAGPLGTGFLLRTDKKTGRSYAEVDELFVRIKAIFTELEIRKLSYAGGNWIFSAAGGKCAKVEELPDVYRCYICVTDGKTSVENEFRVGDQVRCQEFKVKPGVNQNVANRYYWRLVTAVGEDYIDLSKTDCDASSDAPIAGDVMVQLGHRTDPQRQNAIVIAAYGEGSPSITQHAGINSYALAGTEKTRISPTKNTFTGEFLFESGKSVEEAISTQGTQIQQIIKEAASTQATAEAAKQSAEKANTMLTELADDNKLAASEKQDVKKEWDIIVSEKPKNDAAADKFGVSKTQYSTAYNALSAYITPLLANLSVTSSITGSEFRAKFKAYYDARTDLLNAITHKAKQLADNAQVSANSANEKAEQARQNAAAAQASANAAQASANEANVLLADIANDNKLSPVEKQQTKKEWDVIVSEKPKNDTLADKYGISKLAYNTAYNALNTYVTPLLVDLGATSNITGSEFRAKFKAYYDARTDLLNAITHKAKQLADNAQASANSITSQITTIKTEMKALDEQIKLKVSSETFNLLSQKVTSQQSQINLNKDAIASKVSKTELDALGNRVSSAESSITQLNNSIKLKADKSTVEGIDKRLSSAEIALNPDNIWLKVSQKVNKVAADSSKRTEVVIDATKLDPYKYHLVTILLSTMVPVYTIKVSRTLDLSYGKPEWATHANGFSMLCKWSTNACGWGTNVVSRTIEEYVYKHSTGLPVGDIGQMDNSSNEFIYVRGGSKYKFEVEGATGVTITLHTQNFTANSETMLATIGHVTEPEITKPTRTEITSSLGVFANGISLLGHHVDLTGIVTFRSLSQDAQDKINAAQNAADAAQGSANSAQQSASSAATSAQNAYNKALEAYNKKVGLGDLDTTIIDGGLVLTNRIIVKKISAVTGDIGAFKIDSKGLVCDSSSPEAYITVGGTNRPDFAILNYKYYKTMLMAKIGTSNFDTAIHASASGTGRTTLYLNADNNAIALRTYGGAIMKQRAGETWDVPGVLWAGTISSHGSIVDSWGNGTGSTVSASRSSIGNYRIFHSLGRTDYYPSVIALSSGKWPNVFIGSKTANYFDVCVRDNGEIDAELYVIICGRNN